MSEILLVTVMQFIDEDTLFIRTICARGSSHRATVDQYFVREKGNTPKATKHRTTKVHNSIDRLIG